MHNTQSTFLSLVARDLLQRFGTNLSRVTLVFPGKRASIFLNQELAMQSPTPVWTPQYTTMDRLFLSLSELEVADEIDSICLLYQIYKSILRENDTESLDKFWGWAEVILSDFDDIDKHMADAATIFTNVYDLHQLESLDFLTKEQEETLQTFFHHFSVEGNTAIKEKFLRVWSNMETIYRQLRQTQLDQGAVFQGALFRSVAESLNKDDSVIKSLTDDRQAIVFAGFNILNKVEHTLMSAIQKTGKALFYWDYDVSYVCDTRNEAGFFMRQNLKDFPCALPPECFDNLKHLQDVTFISCMSDNAAARYANSWLGQPLDEKENRNAIILCNESMLQPVLHSLDGGQTVNVTMGFPLQDTPIYSFVMALISLQIDGWDKQKKKFRYPFLKTVRHHTYASVFEEEEPLYQGESNESLLRWLIGMVEKVGLQYSQIQEPDAYEQLYIESIFQTHRILSKFLQQTLRPQGALDISQQTLRRLLRSLLCSASVPFHGEPARGLQIMGVLETRCLDFTHMLMLSVEENMLPRNVQLNTMIPPHLREAFSLTTPRHRNAVYAYYFYRLIQRTCHLTCVYNENCIDISHHEMSRFLRQLLAETDIPIRTHWLESKPSLPQNHPVRIEKTAQVMEKLRSRSKLSPTAINMYMDCPVSFYYRYVAGLKVERDLEEGLDAPLIGDIFHDTAQLLYEQIIRRNGGNAILTSTLLTEYLQHSKQLVEPILDIVFDALYFHPASDVHAHATAMLLRGEEPKNEYTGELIIVRTVLLRYLRNLLRHDAAHAPVHILGLEIDRYIQIDGLTVGGRIDRLDIVQGAVRIVDYKTGNHVPKVSSMDQVILPGEKREGYFLQTFLYTQAVAETDKPNLPIRPALFFAGKANRDDYDPTLCIGREPIHDYLQQCSAPFMEGLRAVVSELYDSTRPFLQTTDQRICSRCPFRKLCFAD